MLALGEPTGMKPAICVSYVNTYLKQHWRPAFSAALLLAFGLRLAVLLAADPTAAERSASSERHGHVASRISFTTGDAANYDEMARNLIAGRGLVYGEEDEDKASRPPLYPLFLAFLYVCFGRSALTVGLAHVILGVATCAIVGRLAKQGLGPVAGLLAIIGVAGEPQLLKWSTRAYSETLMVLLVALLVMSHLWAADRKSFWPAAVAGVSVGIASLCRQTILPFALFGGVWLAFKWSRQAYPVVRNTAMYVLAVALVMIAYGTRNYLVQGAPTPLTTKAGGIASGNNSPSAKTIWEDPPRMESGYRGFGQGFESSRRAKQAPARVPNASPLSRHELGRRDFLRFVCVHPLRYLELSISRVMYMWNLWPTPPPSLLFFAAYWIFLLLAVMGGIAYWKRSDLVQLSVLIILCNTLVHGATWAIPRYRVPVVPWVIVLAVVGVLVLIGSRAQDAPQPATECNAIQPD